MLTSTNIGVEIHFFKHLKTSIYVLQARKIIDLKEHFIGGKTFVFVLTKELVTKPWQKYCFVFKFDFLAHLLIHMSSLVWQNSSTNFYTLADCDSNKELLAKSL